MQEGGTPAGMQIGSCSLLAHLLPVAAGGPRRGIRAYLTANYPLGGDDGASKLRERKVRARYRRGYNQLGAPLLGAEGTRARDVVGSQALSLDEAAMWIFDGATWQSIGNEQRSDTDPAVRHPVVDVKPAWLAQVETLVDRCWEDDIGDQPVSLLG